MKIREALEIIDEYERITSVSTASQATLTTALSHSSEIAKFSAKSHQIIIHNSGDRYFILTPPNSSDILGYVEILPFDRARKNMRHVKGACIFDPSLRGSGIVPLAYLQIVRVMGWTLLNDTALTPGGEHIWDSLRKKGFVRKIYDKTSDQFYDPSAVGTTTSDGRTVLLPSEDDRNGVIQEFFWALSHDLPEGVSARKWRKYIKDQKEGVSLLNRGEPLMEYHVMADAYHFQNPTGL